MADPGRRRRETGAGELALVAGAMAACAAAFFHRTFGSFATDVIGPPEDNLRYLWTLWWGHGALRGDLGALLFTDRIFHPEGTSLLYNDYSWYNLLAALPLRLFLGAPATYNLLQLHTFVLAGLGAHLLCRELGAGRTASLAGGFVFAFSPMHVAHSLHHMNISSVQWIPFFALFYLRALRGGRRRDEALAALFFLLDALCSWYYLVFTLYFAAGAALHRAWTAGAPARGAAARVALEVTVPPLLLLGVWLVPMAVESFATGRAGAEGHDTFVVDALGPLVPHYLHGLGGLGPFDAINGSYTGVPWESAGYLGIAALCLAVVALVRRSRGARPAALGAGVFLVLALGSELHVAGNALPVPLPYRILEAVPGLGNVRSPGRAMVFVYLFLAILVSGGLDALLRGLAPRLRPAAAAAAAALLFLDYYTPVSRTAPVALPAAYAPIAADPEEFAIFELPLDWHASDHYMMYQTLHGVPIVGGQLPRRTGTGPFDALLEDDGDVCERLRGARDALVAARVKYVVVDAALFASEDRDLPPRCRALLHELGFTTVFDSGRHLVVRTY